MKIILDSTDKRLNEVKSCLIKEKFQVEELNYYKNKDEEVIYIFSPAFKWNEEKLNSLNNNSILFCGKIDEQLMKKIKEKNINYFNVMNDEEFVVKNAKLTAEGALCDLILNTDYSIGDAKILITGSGRISKALGLIFKDLNLDFDFCMRNEKDFYDFKLISQTHKLSSIDKLLKNYNVIFNTIPYPIFQNEKITFKNQTKVFELASKSCFPNLIPENVNYINCPGLPSKYTPITAGKLIFESFKKNISKLKE